MQISKPQVFTAIVTIGIIAIIVLFAAPGEAVEKLVLAAIVAISNIGMALLAK